MPMSLLLKALPGALVWFHPLCPKNLLKSTPFSSQQRFELQYSIVLCYPYAEVYGMIIFFVIILGYSNGN